MGAGCLVLVPNKLNLTPAVGVSRLRPECIFRNLRIEFEKMNLMILLLMRIVTESVMKKEKALQY